MTEKTSEDMNNEKKVKEVLQNLGAMYQENFLIEDEPSIDLEKCISDFEHDVTELVKDVFKPDQFVFCNNCEKIRGVVSDYCMFCHYDDIVTKEHFKKDLKNYYENNEDDEDFLSHAKDCLRDIGMLEMFFFDLEDVRNAKCKDES